MQRQNRLLRFALHCYKFHPRTLRCLPNRLRIRGIALVALDKRPHKLTRDQANFMTQRRKRPANGARCRRLS